MANEAVHVACRISQICSCYTTACSSRIYVGYFVPHLGYSTFFRKVLQLHRVFIKSSPLIPKFLFPSPSPQSPSQSLLSFTPPLPQGHCPSPYPSESSSPLPLPLHQRPTFRALHH